MLIPILVFTGLFLIAIDRAFGLGYLFAAFGLVALVSAALLGFGISPLDYGVLVEMALLALFVPIVVRLAILMHRPRDADMPPPTFEDRNAGPVLKGLLASAGPIKTFTTHSLGLALILGIIAHLAGWIAPNPMLLVVGSTVGAHFGGLIADARGVTDPRKKINWGVLGLLLCTLLCAGVVFVSLMWEFDAIARGERMPRF